jgi:serine/threonine-protein kinase
MLIENGSRSERLLNSPEPPGIRSATSIDGPYAPVMGSSGMSYRPLQELGEGGMARIFLACGVGSAGFTKLVVLKMLRRHLVQDPVIRQMFQAEARLSARLNHPNLVQVHEVVEADLPFLVMEYLDGKAMSAVKAGRGVTQRMLLTIISEALVGLHHAHELCDFDGKPLNIVHRDVSPHNIFITYDGAVKVLDFGIAKAATAASHTETGEIKGKLTYMAPEQLLGGTIDRRADIFSVGCMIWEAGVGLRMWDEIPEARLMHQLATGEIPRPRDRGLVDPPLERIILKATAAKADDRYETALQLQQDLSAYLEDHGTRHSMREIGAALADSFKEQREKHKEALARALREPVSLVVEASPGSRADAFTPSRGGVNRMSQTPATGRVASVVLPDSAFPSIAATPPRRTTWLWAPVMLLVLGVAGAAYWRSKSAPLEPRPAVAVASAATVRIHVRAFPPEAAIEIDGKLAGAGAATLTPTAESAEHLVRATAPGYATKTQTVSFDRNRDVEIRLEPAASAAATAPAVAPPATPPSATVHVVAPTAPRRAVPPKRKGTSEENPCTPPYYFVNGIKTYRPECLQ